MWGRLFKIILPRTYTMDLRCVVLFPICIKVLLIALISSDEWWLHLYWIFTIDAFFIDTP